MENSRPDAAPLPTVGAMLRRPLALVVPVLVLALVGCSSPTVIPPAAPPSDEAPLFATDEEALAAATAAYEEFLAALDSKLQDPPAEDIDLGDFASSQALDEATESVDRFVTQGLRITDARAVIATELQMFSELSAGVEVVIYACESVEGVDLLNTDGESLVEEGRPDLSGWEAAVIFNGESVSVDSRNQWAGEGVC